MCLGFVKFVCVVDLLVSSWFYVCLDCSDFIDCYWVWVFVLVCEVVNIIIWFFGWVWLLVVLWGVVICFFGLWNDIFDDVDVVGIFFVELEIEMELIVGFNDKYFDFRVLVLFDGGQVYLVIWVYLYNIVGWFYLVVIMLFYILIVWDVFVWVVQEVCDWFGLSKVV